jgi:hypothetical protein
VGCRSPTTGAPKSERLLWPADAIAGAVGEYLVGKDPIWWEMLNDLGIVSLQPHP